MATVLMNYLRIPGDLPNGVGLAGRERVEAAVALYGGKRPAQGSVEAFEGAWLVGVATFAMPRTRRDGTGAQASADAPSRATGPASRTAEGL
jgi:hypothetical protein